MSADFTGGYGPEEFARPTARPGTCALRTKTWCCAWQDKAGRWPWARSRWGRSCGGR